MMEGCADAWRGAREQCGRVAHWLLHGRGSRSASGRHRDLPDASSTDDLQGLEKSTAVLLQGLGDSTAILMRSDQESTPVIRGGRGFNRGLCLLLFIAAAAVGTDLTLRILHATHVVGDCSSASNTFGDFKSLCNVLSMM